MFFLQIHVCVCIRFELLVLLEITCIFGFVQRASSFSSLTSFLINWWQWILLINIINIDTKHKDGYIFNRDLWVLWWIHRQWLFHANILSSRDFYPPFPGLVSHRIGVMPKDQYDRIFPFRKHLDKAVVFYGNH